MTRKGAEVAEPITTLDADLTFFDRSATAVGMLECFLTVAGAEITSAVLDPLALELPDELGDEQGEVRGLIEAVEGEPAPKRKFLAVTERAYDVADPGRRQEYARLAYCSTLATVWGRGTSVLFEATDYGAAKYWLPDSLKAAFFAQLTADGTTIPPEWQAAIAKEPKPWWRRRS